MDEKLHVWGVQGDPDKLLWVSKIDAERHARELFPEESVHKRYARIFFMAVYAYN